MAPKTIAVTISGAARESAEPRGRESASTAGEAIATTVRTERP